MGMKISRRPGESLLIGDNVLLKILAVGPGYRPKIVFEVFAPHNVRVRRSEEAYLPPEPVAAPADPG